MDDASTCFIPSVDRMTTNPNPTVCCFQQTRKSKPCICCPQHFGILMVFPCFISTIRHFYVYCILYSVHVRFALDLFTNPLGCQLSSILPLSATISCGNLVGSVWIKLLNPIGCRLRHVEILLAVADEPLSLIFHLWKRQLWGTGVGPAYRPMAGLSRPQITPGLPAAH